MTHSVDPVTQSTPSDSVDPWDADSQRRRMPRLSMVVAAVLLTTVLALSALVPLLPGYDPYAQDLRASLLGPMSTFDGRTYILGTDSLGRDILSRLALAGRISIMISVLAVVISFIVGVTLGLIAGFFRGWTDHIVMGIADLQLSIPRVLLLIAVVAVVGPSIPTLVILLGLTSWIVYGRVARAMALSLREREFVLSAITQGASSLWNIRRHLFPNVFSQMLIVGSFELGQVIVMESSLSYLGLGVQPPRPSWGRMISDGQDYMQVNPWLTILPGLAIFMLIGSIQILSQRYTAEGASDPSIAGTAGG
jgi:peptide/nickel transport system permease protein